MTCNNNSVRYCLDLGGLKALSERASRTACPQERRVADRWERACAGEGESVRAGEREDERDTERARASEHESEREGASEREQARAREKVDGKLRQRIGRGATWHRTYVVCTVIAAGWGRSCRGKHVSDTLPTRSARSVRIPTRRVISELGSQWWEGGGQDGGWVGAWVGGWIDWGQVLAPACE